MTFLDTWETLLLMLRQEQTLTNVNLFKWLMTCGQARLCPPEGQTSMGILIWWKCANSQVSAMICAKHCLHWFVNALIGFFFVLFLKGWHVQDIHKAAMATQTLCQWVWISKTTPVLIIFPMHKMQCSKTQWQHHCPVNTSSPLKLVNTCRFRQVLLRHLVQQRES